jgi:hypothetical protein
MLNAETIAEARGRYARFCPLSDFHGQEGFAKSL